MYRQFDYYGGKPWLVGFLYAYGGTTMLHGDLADIAPMRPSAAADPQADQCRGLCIEPEAIHHNPLVFDLISRLARNPSEVDLSASWKITGAAATRAARPAWSAVSANSPRASILRRSRLPTVYARVTEDG